jgi:hypothetical protein
LKAYRDFDLTGHDRWSELSMQPEQAAAIRRHLMGVAGLLLLITGIALWIWPVEGANATFWHGSSIKSGLVLLAAWLAFPQLQHLPGWILTWIVVLALAVAVRPRIVLALTRVAWVFVPILVVIWLLRPRPKRGNGRTGQPPS